MSGFAVSETWQAPCGALALVAADGLLVRVVFRADPDAVARELARDFPDSRLRDVQVFRAARLQLDGYFSGQLMTFDLPLDWNRVDGFYRRCLEELAQIPYGRTVSYGELAALAGSPGAARAVGSAMARNPWPLIIPCHRVLSAGGRQGGYSGGCGLASKSWLLEWEQRHL
ncbi:MAG: hypothetical protein Tsb0017_00060 [Geothermobacteraceae bacterium]